MVVIPFICFNHQQTTILAILAVITLFALLFIRIDYDVKVSKRPPQDEKTTEVYFAYNDNEVFHHTWGKKDENENK